MRVLTYIGCAVLVLVSMFIISYAVATLVDGIAVPVCIVNIVAVIAADTIVIGSVISRDKYND